MHQKNPTGCKQVKNQSSGGGELVSLLVLGREGYGVREKEVTGGLELKVLRRGKSCKNCCLEQELPLGDDGDHPVSLESVKGELLEGMQE